MTKPADNSSGSPRWRALLDLATTAAVLLAAVILIWVVVAERIRPPARAAARTEPPLPDQPIRLEETILGGSRTAPVGLVVYSEFECPFCGAFARDTLPEIEKVYVATGRVLLAFRHFPLEAIHRSAVKAATTAECAFQQGKFWEMHGELFKLPMRLADKDLLQHAIVAGLDRERFETCWSASAAEAKVRKDMAAGTGLQIRGTPTFMIGVMGEGLQLRVRARLTGALPFERFRGTLDGLLAEVR